jgi:hypothetical protein
LECKQALNLLLIQYRFKREGKDPNFRRKELLCEGNLFEFIFFQFVSVIYNSCLCLDLILTLKNPFFPGSRRNKFYHMFAFIIPASLIWFLRGDIKEPCKVGGKEDTVQFRNK